MYVPISRVCEKIMNEIHLNCVLQERYNTHFKGLIGKLVRPIKQGAACSFYKGSSSRPAGDSMQKSLKLKLQNVLSHLQPLEGDSPALIVGGRRRNRRKRKHRNANNGKRKGKKTSAAPSPQVVTPTGRYKGSDLGKPSCLDLTEPVFATTPPSPVVNKLLIRNYDSGVDSLYNSSNSLASSHSAWNVGAEVLSSSTSDIDLVTDVTDDVEVDDDFEFPQETGQVENNLQAELKKAFCNRLHSHDSGFYDGSDEDEDDSGDENEDELQQNETEDKNITEFTAEKGQVDVEKIDTLECSDLADCDNEAKETKTEDQPEESEASECDDATMLDVQQLELNTVEISQLPPNTITDNNTDNTTDTNIKETTQQLPFAESPARLEEEEEKEENILYVDLEKIESDDDVVIFETRGSRIKSSNSELHIMSNPLYEHVLKQEEEEEEEKVSIRKYQSGFGPGFEKHNVLKIPVPAISSRGSKESSPLITQRKPGGGQDDEIACCVIL